MGNLGKFLKGSFGNIFKYSMLKYVALVLSFLKGIVNAKFLGPELIGLLGNFTLILGYCLYANLGVINAMNREFVICRERNEEKSKKVINTTFSFILCLSIIFLICGITAIVINRDILGVYLLLVFLIAIFDQFANFFTNYFRLIDNYNMINFIELVNGLISFLLTLLLVDRFKILGILIAMLLCGVITLIVGCLKLKEIKIEFDFKIMKDLVYLGIPLLIYNLGYYILSTVDRLVIIKMLDNEKLGYYTFGNSMALATLVFTGSILFLIYPKVIKEFNEDNSTGILDRVTNYTKLVEIGNIILLVLGTIAFKPFIDIFLPQFKNSVSVYNLLVIGIIITNLGYFANVYIVSNKKQVYLVYLQILSIIVNLGLNIFFVKIGLDIKAIALGTLIANLIYSIVQHCILMKMNTKKIQINYIFRVYSKITILAIVLTTVILLNINYIILNLVLIVTVIALYSKEIKNINFYKEMIKEIL